MSNWARDGKRKKKAGRLAMHLARPVAPATAENGYDRMSIRIYPLKIIIF
jgi:hypothetical protein